MFKKLVLIFKDFYKSINLSEFIELVFIPLFMVVVLFLLINDSLKMDFIKEFNGDILTISSLLVAFGLSSITLLFSTSNNNIEKAKEFITSRVNNSGFNINYFQLIQIRAYYAVLCELVLIILTLISKLLLIKYNLYFMFYVNIFLLIHILFVLSLSIINMYHLSWKDR